jgi:hypothetical protein
MLEDCRKSQLELGLPQHEPLVPAPLQPELVQPEEPVVYQACWMFPLGEVAVRRPIQVWMELRLQEPMEPVQKLAYLLPWQALPTSMEVDPKTESEGVEAGHSPELKAMEGDCRWPLVLNLLPPTW